MTDIVTEAREALEGITPGPWRHDVDSEYGETSHIVRPANAGEDGLAVGIFTGNYGGAGADADFIAAAPDLVSRLCVEVEAMRTRNDRQKRGLQQMDDALRKANKERADAEARSRATDASEFLRFLNALAHVAAERDEALAVIDRVRELHRPHESQDGDVVCPTCVCGCGDCDFNPLEAPCPTIRALDGGDPQ